MMLQRDLNKKEFRNNLLFYSFTSPDTIYPIGVGAFLLVLTVAFGIKSPIAMFCGLVSLLIGAGFFLTRLLSSNKLSKNIAKRMLQAEADKTEQRLQGLHYKLQQDGDKRTEKLLGDIRSMSKSFEGTEFFKDANKDVLNIVAKVGALMEESIKLLEVSCEMQRSRDSISNNATRKKIKEGREAVIDKVKTSVEKLGEVLAHVQTQSAMGAVSTKEIDSITHDLDIALSAARQADEMSMLRDGLSEDDREDLLQYAGQRE